MDLANGVGGAAPTGIPLPSVSRIPRPPACARAGCSQYADDTAAYLCSQLAVGILLALIESEFCRASGARLHRRKTLLLLVGQHVHRPEFIHGARVLSEHDSVKSLGALLSTRANAPGPLPAVLQAMEQRLARLQRFAPSLEARALLANSLLNSCLWYFLQFEQLTAAACCTQTRAVSQPGERLRAHASVPHAPLVGSQ